jgi:hypothetical protein
VPEGDDDGVAAGDTPDCWGAGVDEEDASAAAAAVADDSRITSDMRR